MRDPALQASDLYDGGPRRLPPRARRAAAVATLLAGLIGPTTHAPAATSGTSREVPAGSGVEGAPATPPNEARFAPDPSEARRLLQRPSGPLSLGAASEGELLDGVRLPQRGKGWALLDRTVRRGMRYATPEVAALLDRVAARLRAVHDDPEPVVRVGNVSPRGGGESRWHASHQSGRDIDLVILARNAEGEPVTPRRFASYEPDGRSERGGYRFDAQRNLTLVTALLDDPHVEVQWIFIAEWLRQRLLEAAEQRGLPPSTISRLERLVHQPSASTPHANHFHVRIYCGLDDRLHGCREGPPIWPWTDREDVRRDRRIARLRAVLSMDDPELRARAAKLLGHMHAGAAVRDLADALRDPAERVRRAALEAVRDMGDARALDGLLKALRGASERAWAVALFGALEEMKAPRTARLAQAFVRRPSDFLHADVRESSLAPFRLTVARVLERHGRKSAVPTLLSFLSMDASDVREAAHEALVRITNHAPNAPAGARASIWRTFWRDRRDEPWESWIRSGFDEAGYRLGDDSDDDPPAPETEAERHAVVERLIDAVGDHRQWLSDNAVRLLGELTGHVRPHWDRSPRARRRHWQHWWSEQRDGDGS